MSAKKFYVEYLEDSPPSGLKYGDEVLRVTDHFAKGPATGANHGFKRRKDMLGYVARTNTAVGREIVREFKPAPPAPAPPPPKVVPPLTPETLERYGPVDPQPGRYYVSARDGDREWLLLGPLPRHELALRMVRPVITLAYEANPFSAFYAFGTLRVKDAAADLGPGSANQFFPEAFAEAAKEAA
jgi:hypothetical protein